MNYENLSNLEPLPMPITQSSLQLARQFAAQQRHPQRQEQVYFNTLAVLAVHDYLQILNIETDLTECDSWNPAMRLFTDAADLYIKGLGKIECRPVRNLHQNQATANDNLSANPPVNCPVPVEARADRIGYIAVEIDEDEKAAKLLGFSPNAETGELVLSELHSLDDFLVNLEHLFDAKVDLNQWLVNVFNPDWQPFEAIFDPESLEDSPGEIENPIPSKLGNWFKNIVETGWQKFDQGKQNLEETIFPDENPNFAFRSAGNSRQNLSLSGGQASLQQRFPEADVARARLIDLGMQLGRTTVALLVAIAQQSDRTVRVHVQLHPAIGQSYLPPHTKLSLISDTGKILHKSESTVQDLCILLKDFEVEPEESFSIRVAIDDLSITENFVV